MYYYLHGWQLYVVLRWYQCGFTSILQAVSAVLVATLLVNSSRLPAFLSAPKCGASFLDRLRISFRLLSTSNVVLNFRFNWTELVGEGPTFVSSFQFSDVFR